MNMESSSALNGFAPAAVVSEKRSDGSILLRCPRSLGPYARCIGEYLEHWAQAAPDRVFLAERQRAGLAPGYLCRGIGRSAGHWCQPAGAKAFCRQAAGDPVRQQCQSRPADAGGHARRRAGGAGVAGLFRDVAGSPQAAVHPRSAQSRFDLRLRWRQIRAGDAGGGHARCAAGDRQRRGAGRACRHPVQRIARRARRGGSGSRLRRRRSRQHRQDTVHFGLHRRPQGRGQYPAHALLQPAGHCPELALPRSPAAGGGRLATVEPYLRRQPQLQHDPEERRHALCRRRQAGAGPDRKDRRQPARRIADDVFQRTPRLRHADSVSGAGRRPAQALLCRSGHDFLCGGGSAAEFVAATGGAFRAGAGPCHGDAVGVGRDGNRADDHQCPFQDRPGRRHRAAGAGL